MPVPRKRLLKSLVVLLFLAFTIGAVVYSESLKPRARIGEPAPGFTLKDLDGREFSLADFKGRPVFLNFWNEWCDPCRDEAPDLQLFHEKYGDQVVLIGINRGDPVPLMKDFMDEFGLTYLNLRDADVSVSDSYGVTGVPESYFIDSQGILRYKHLGPMTLSMMEEVIKTMAPIHP